MIPIPAGLPQHLAILAAVAVASWVGGCTHERNENRAQMAAAELLADAKTERLTHELDQAKATKDQSLALVADVYQRDLDSLRNRPPRRVEVIRSAACEGVTGAQLSKEDAGFLVGEAARAERIRIERDEIAERFNALLAACSSGE